AAIAVNGSGIVAYLYQSLIGNSPSQHWQTHLRYSIWGKWADATLADFPAQGAGSPTGSRIIGDYLNLISVGSSFYGVFSSYNDPTTATFPSGIAWQRNKTADGVMPPKLLGNDGTTPITASIDPFFVELDVSPCDYSKILCNICPTHYLL